VTTELALIGAGLVAAAEVGHWDLRRHPARASAPLLGPMATRAG
jgi:hypothetical protein